MVHQERWRLAVGFCIAALVATTQCGNAESNTVRIGYGAATVTLPGTWQLRPKRHFEWTWYDIGPTAGRTRLKLLMASDHVDLSREKVRRLCLNGFAGLEVVGGPLAKEALYLPVGKVPAQGAYFEYSRSDAQAKAVAHSFRIQGYKPHC
jgi:hypothetical protein